MSFIYNLAATWNAIGTTFSAIKMDVSNGAGGAPVGAAASRALNLLKNGVPFFEVAVDGRTVITGDDYSPGFGTGTTLKIIRNKDVSSLDLVSDNSSGNFLRIKPGFDWGAGAGQTRVYINDGGGYYSQAWAVISGTFTGTGDGLAIHPASAFQGAGGAAGTPVTAQSCMLSLWADTQTAWESRVWVGTPGGRHWTAFDRDGKYVLAVEENGNLAWAGASATYAFDVGLSRTAAATLAIGNGTAGDFTGTLRSTNIRLQNNGAIQSNDSGGTSRNIFQLDTGNALNIGNAAISHTQFFTGDNAELRILDSNGAKRIASFQESSASVALGNSGSNFDGTVTVFDNTATTGDSTLCLRNGAARAARMRFGTGGTYDVGLNREAAGLLALQDASTTLTNYRDLKLRNVITPGVTVASLQSAATQGAGARAFVTDALAPTFGATVVGGGAVNIPVHSDGTNWKVG